MDILGDLSEIGFTEYEAKVYLALLRLHPSTGYQLSKSSGVPRSMVYETLSRLHNRGAILETVEGRATLYRPLPPKVLLDRHEADHSQRVQKLRLGLEAYYQAEEDDRVWSIKGRSSVLAYAGQMIREAEKEVYLVLTDSDLQALGEEIHSAFGRGVEISTLLTGDGELATGRVARHPPLESELQEVTDLLLVVAEKSEVLIASPGAQQEVMATITNNRDLVLIARQFVWMELFTQRIYARIGSDLLDRLEPEDRQIFESLEA